MFSGGRESLHWKQMGENGKFLIHLVQNCLLFLRKHDKNKTLWSVSDIQDLISS